MSEDILRLTSDLYLFVKDSESLTNDSKATINLKRFREWGEDLRLRFERVKAKTNNPLHTPIGSVRDNLRTMLDELRKKNPNPGNLRTTWLALGKNYEALALRLEKASPQTPEGITLNRLKPKNYVRNLFHITNSLWAILLYEFLLTKSQITIVAGAFLGLAVWMETIRRLSPKWNRWFVDKIFGAVSRPHEEYSITSATWYTLALFIGVIVMPQHAIEAGTLMLGIGDPMAAIAGMKWGKRRLVGNKTLEGFLGFFVSSMLALSIFFWLVTPMGLSKILLVSAGVSLAGSLTELYSGKIEDNFSIPLVGGFVAMALMALI